MNSSIGLKQMQLNIENEKRRRLDILNGTFDRLKEDAGRFVAQSGNAYMPLVEFSSKHSPTRSNAPQGFLYGKEEIKDLNGSGHFVFPLIYEFLKENATAIEENGNSAHLLFNFALRAIMSYPFGDSNVYMLDSNVSGDFNRLSSISTDLNDTDTEKNFFHYITSDNEKSELLSKLEKIMDRNVRNYVSRYPNMYEYNKQNETMFESYHFVFIKDIGNTLPGNGQMEKLARLVRMGNATKAGIYIFYTYNKNQMEKVANSYYTDNFKSLQLLLDQSHIIEKIDRIDSDSELSIEPMADISIANKVVDFVNEAKPVRVVMSFKKDIEAMLQEGNLWKNQKPEKKNHLFIPVGYENAVTKKVVDISFSGASPHIYVGGKTGSGKSILLHNFILNGALKYSPEQLRFYLVDMKGGVSFVGYKKLPHIAALSASSSRHYAESLLELFCKEIDNRTSIFRRFSATSLDSYNEMAKERGEKTLPYCFAIIDEFQELFGRNDSISRDAQRSIEYIHRLGRAAGVFLALCTQQPPSNVSRSQVGLKLSLICRPNDSIALIGNDGASRLKGIGRAIINTTDTGEERYNQEFQTAYVDEKNDLPRYVERINEIWLSQNNGVDPLDHMIYDDNELEVAISTNEKMQTRKSEEQTHLPSMYVGMPGFYRKEHVKFYFHRDSQSNVVVVGGDRPSALRLSGIVALQFLASYPRTGSKVFIADLQRQTEPTYGKLEFLGGDTNVKHCYSYGVKDMTKEVYDILEQRRQNRMQSVNEPELLYIIEDLKPDGNFTAGGGGGGFGFGAPTEKSCLAMLNELVSDGPDLGIHVMVYCYNYKNMSDLLNNFSDSMLGKIEVKIGLKGGNSSKLFSYGNNQEIVDRYGEGFIRMPEDMGLKYCDGDDYGDPFRIYDTLGDDRLRDSQWEKLFNNLPNRSY